MYVKSLRHLPVRQKAGNSNNWVSAPKPKPATSAHCPYFLASLPLSLRLQMVYAKWAITYAPLKAQMAPSLTRHYKEHDLQMLSNAVQN